MKVKRTLDTQSAWTQWKHLSLSQQVVHYSLTVALPLVHAVHTQGAATSMVHVNRKPFPHQRQAAKKIFTLKRMKKRKRKRKSEREDLQEVKKERLRERNETSVQFSHQMSSTVCTRISIRGAREREREREKW